MIREVRIWGRGISRQPSVFSLLVDVEKAKGPGRREYNFIWFLVIGLI